MKKNIVYNQKSRKKIDEKTLLNALEIVWANETVQKAEIEGNPDKDELKKIIKRKIIRNSRKIAQGVEELQDCIDKKQFLSQSGTSIDDLIGNLGGDSKLRECYKHYYCEEKPQVLYKYIKKDYACKSVQNSWFRCGTAEDYRKDDRHEMNALLDFNQPPSEDDFCGTVLSEVAFEILSENNCDIEEKKEDVNQMIGRMFCIGCLCEDPNIDQMWENYGQDGICIGFDTSGMNAHRITYSDAPLDAGYIRGKFLTVCERIGHGNLDNVGKEFTAILNLVASMGLLNLYRKDCQYSYESEWRLLIEPDKLETNKDGRFKMARIQCVTSSLPDEKDRELKKYCDEHGIQYERRKNL